jgi:N-acetylglutamate synthase-like GNAT family acetyltransferase
MVQIIPQDLRRLGFDEMMLRKSLELLSREMTNFKFF